MATKKRNDTPITDLNKYLTAEEQEYCNQLYYLFVADLKAFDDPNISQTRKMSYMGLYEYGVSDKGPHNSTISKLIELATRGEIWANHLIVAHGYVCAQF